MAEKVSYSSQWIDDRTRVIGRTLFIPLGVVLLTLLAQIAIPLPFSPVPITGQSFGVALLSLVGGRKWGFPSVLAYVLLGMFGLPIFSKGLGGLALPTSGYLVGMCASSLLIGSLSDSGFTRNFWGALASCFMGSFFVFCFGLIVLLHFVPRESLFVQGLWPFLLGDAVKSVLASAIACRVGTILKF